MLLERPVKLTKRQFEILSLLGTEGDPNKLIAVKLDTTEATVRVHLKAIIRKSGLKNRVQLAIAFCNQKDMFLVENVVYEPVAEVV